jgi:outer membrane protein OmpA-like peptidoglycan-associated protein
LIEATESIYFEKGQQQWRLSSEKHLVQIAELLKKNAGYTLKLGGHTDSKGTEEANMRLSILRAEAVKKHLVHLGVAHFRIKAVGYGAHRPITTNETAAGKALNRRVSCRIIKK